MAFKCKHHPGRAAVFEYDGVHYCEKCKTGFEAAVRKVELTNRHVEAASGQQTPYDVGPRGATERKVGEQ